MNTLLKRIIQVVFALQILSGSAVAQVYDFAEEVFEAISREQGSPLSEAQKIVIAENMEVAGINNDSWIVGHYQVSDGINRLFVWAPGDADPTEDDLYPEDTVYLIGVGLKALSAMGISNTKTIIYNYIEETTDPSTGEIKNVTVGAHRKFENDQYAGGVGTSNFVMKAISESWVVGDYIITDGEFHDYDNECDLFINAGGGFLPTVYTRAMRFNLAGGGVIPAVNREIAFREARECRFSSAAFSVKATPDNQLLYVGGESYGRGRGQEKFTNAHAMIYDHSTGQTRPVIGDTPGRVRGVNSNGTIVGTWFRKYVDDFPGALHGFHSGVFCTGGTDDLPLNDMMKKSNVKPNSINEEGWTVGSYGYTPRPTTSEPNPSRQSRGFVYQNPNCTDGSGNLANDQRFDASDLSRAMKDLTVFASSTVGTDGWELLGPAQGINDSMQVVGNRGLDPLGNRRPYLINLLNCDDLPARDVIRKGIFVAQNEDDHVNDTKMMTFFEQQETESELALNAQPALDLSLFSVLDKPEGPNGNGWYIHEKPGFGPEPDEEVTLATNILDEDDPNNIPSYINNARHTITSKTFRVPSLTSTPFAFSDAEELPINEVFITFKAWAHIENGPYDFAKIRIRKDGSGPKGWITLGYLWNTTNQGGWTEYAYDVPSQLGGEVVELEFTFRSDICNAGMGVLMKDFKLESITEPVQVALFAKFMDEATNDNVLADVEAFLQNTSGRQARAALSVAPEVAVRVPQTVAELLRLNGVSGTGIASSASGAPIGSGLATTLGSVAVVGAVVYYLYTISPQPVESILLSAAPAVLNGNQGLEERLANKRNVFFSGLPLMLTNLSSEVRTAYYAYALNGLLKVQNEALSATNGDPAYVETFSDANSKNVSIVIPTEIGSAMNIHNNRLMFKKMFGELALLTKEINVSIYVYDTYINEYYEVTKNNNDYYNAYREALRALNWADNIISQVAPPEIDTKPDEAPEIDFAEYLRLEGFLDSQEDDCQAPPDVKPVTPPTDRTELEPEKPPLPIPITNKLFEPCGDFTVIVGRRGQGSIEKPSQPKPNPEPSSGCKGLISPPSLFECFQNPAERAKNLQANDNQPNWFSSNFSTVFLPVIDFPNDDSFIEEPQADHYLDGQIFNLKLKEGYKFFEGAYSSEITSQEMIAAGIKPKRKEIDIKDLDPDKDDVQMLIDNIVFEGDDLAQSTQRPFLLVPQDGRYRLDVCAYNESTRDYEKGQQHNHVLSNLLHKIEPDGKQSVFPNIGSPTDPGFPIVTNTAIFIPGYNEDSYMRDGTKRKYEHEDLVYLDESTLSGIFGPERISFFDKWDGLPTASSLGWDTYVLQSPAFLEPGPGINTDQGNYNEILNRFFLPDFANGAWWYDSWKKERRRNTFDDVLNNPAPLDGVVNRDIEVIENIFQRMAVTTVLGEEKVVAIYGENVSAIRALLAVEEVIRLNQLELGVEEISPFSNLRVVIGMLDPVWPLDYYEISELGVPTVGLMNDKLAESIEFLSTQANVTVFVAHSQTPPVQEEIYPISSDFWQNNVMEYDLSVIEQYKEGNPQLLLKFIHALGPDSFVDMAYCTGSVPAGVQTDVLGSTEDFRTCLSTFNENINEQALSAYMGAGCELHRLYFQLIETDSFGQEVKTRNSYKMKGHDFTGPGNIFQFVRDNNPELDKFILEINNITPGVEQLMEEIITSDSGN